MEMKFRLLFQWIERGDFSSVEVLRILAILEELNNELLVFNVYNCNPYNFYMLSICDSKNRLTNKYLDTDLENFLNSKSLYSIST